VTGRSPARLLAPLALVVTAVALIAVLASGGGSSSKETSAPVHPSATATPSSAKADARKSSKRRTYTVRAGDTPSAIADAVGVPLEDLLAANPGIDPNALTVGQKLTLP
jgi:LysM repeat protein